VGLSDFLEVVLDLLDHIVLLILLLLESASDHADGLRIDSRCVQNLIDLGFFRLQTFLDGLELLL